MTWLDPDSVEIVKLFNGALIIRDIEGVEYPLPVPIEEIYSEFIRELLTKINSIAQSAETRGGEHRAAPIRTALGIADR